MRHPRAGTPHRGPRELVDPAVVRARVLLTGLFGLNGLMYASQLARLPSIRDALEVSPAQLGLMLLAASVGSLGTILVAGAIVTRFGARAALTAAALGFLASYVLLGLGTHLAHVPLVLAGFLLSGASFAVGNVPLNVESSRIERRYGRTILPQFHAAFSIGAVVGSLLGAGAAGLGMTVLTQFLLVAAVCTGVRLWSIPSVVLDRSADEIAAAELAVSGARALPAAATGDESAEPTVQEIAGPPVSRFRAALGSWTERRTLLIGLIVFAAALSEGSAYDWLSIAVVDGFAQTEAVGGVAFGLFVGAMTAMRLAGTRLIDRYGGVTVLRLSGVVSVVGLLLFGFAPRFEVAAAGIVLWGFGAALAIPIGIAAVSEEPLKAAGRVAVVSAFSSIASLAAPPLLGFAAEHVGIRHALVLIVVGMVISVTLSRQVAPTRTATVADEARGRAPEEVPA